MFKSLMYDKVVTQLNDSTQDTVFQGGYLIGLYNQGSPYVVDSSTLSVFDYQREIVIPVSEEYFTETPSVHAADRSDYVAQYQIMFETTRETEVMTVMDEFRDYFFANKQFTLDGYNVSIKTTRGEKQAGVPVDRGGFYVRFKINVYLTAIKSGYIYKDTDIWQVRLPLLVNYQIVVGKSYQIVTVGSTNFISIGASSNTVGVIFVATGLASGTGTVIMTTEAVTNPTTYQTLKLAEDIFATNGNTTFSNEDGNSKGLVSSLTSNSKLLLFYNETDMEKIIYKWIMKKIDKDTLFQFLHTFNDETFLYTGIISKGVRVKKDNSIAILEIDWIEADV